jgi:hypothetical protein
MFFLLMVPVFFLVSTAHRYLQLYAPSNMLITWMRVAQPRGRHALLLLSVLASTALLAMHVLAQAVAAGAPGWLNLIVLILAWDAIKLGLAAVFVTLRWMRLVVATVAGSALRRRPRTDGSLALRG